MPRDAGFLQDGGERLGLFVGGEDRAADQPLEIGAFVDQRVETIEIGFDGVEFLLFEGQLEQRGGIAASHAGDGRSLSLICHHGPVEVFSQKRNPQA